MSKQIFTKKQAVSILVQINNNMEPDMFKEVSLEHKFFSFSCDELENKLKQFIDADSIAGVVDEVF